MFYFFSKNERVATQFLSSHNKQFIENRKQLPYNAKSTNGLLVQESAGKSAGKVSMMEGKGRGKVLRHPFKEFPILKDKQKLAF